MPVYTRNGRTDSTLPRPKGLLTFGEQARSLSVPAGLELRESFSEGKRNSASDFSLGY
jgi:hypothetical protein